MRLEERIELNDLRAEVASLKEELGRQKACTQDMVVTVHSLTQQLAAANDGIAAMQRHLVEQAAQLGAAMSAQEPKQ